MHEVHPARNHRACHERAQDRQGGTPVLCRNQARCLEPLSGFVTARRGPPVLPRRLTLNVPLPRRRTRQRNATHQGTMGRLAGQDGLLPAVRNTGRHATSRAPLQHSGQNGTGAAGAGPGAPRPPACGPERSTPPAGLAMQSGNACPPPGLFRSPSSSFFLGTPAPLSTWSLRVYQARGDALLRGPVRPPTGHHTGPLARSTPFLQGVFPRTGWATFPSVSGAWPTAPQKTPTPHSARPLSPTHLGVGVRYRQSSSSRLACVWSSPALRRSSNRPAL
jgi:hypothetical protein